MKSSVKISKRAPAAERLARRDPAFAAVVVLDPLGRIADSTADAAAMLGYEPRDLAGRPLTELAAPGWKAVAEDVAARIRSGTKDTLELMLCGRSGRRTMLQMRAREIDVPGRVCGSHVVAWRLLEPRADGNVAVCTRDQELRRLAYSLLTNHEEERSRVAAELHDGVVPLVFMAKLMIEDGLLRMSNGSRMEASEALVKALGRLRDVSNEIRRISMELRPRMLDDLGLLPTIEWYLRTFTAACSATRLERHLAAEEGHIAGSLKLEIFRILQEALNNVAQHAAASNALVMLVEEGGELRLTVEDDGIGFDAEHVIYGSKSLPGVGLQTIRKRICATEGRLILESSPGAGTRIGASWRVH